MSSTFITHLRVGSKLVNARGVHQFYHSRISGWSLLVLVLAAAVTVFVAVVFSPASPILARYFEATWHSFTYWLTGKLLVIDFRYHLVSIVAVFLALAIGIVLGSTELQGPAFSLLDKTTSKLQSELGQVSSQRDTAQQQATEGEMYAQAVEPALLHNLLTGHRLLHRHGAGGAVLGGQRHHRRRDPRGRHRYRADQPRSRSSFDTSGTAQDSLNQTTPAAAQPTGLQLGRQRDLPAAGRPADRERDTDQRARVARPGETGGDQGTSTDASTMPQAHAASQFLSTSGLAGHAYQPGRRGDPADRAVGRQRADQLAQCARPGGPGAGGQERGHRGGGFVDGLRRGQPPIAVLRSNNVSSRVSSVDDADLAAGQTARHAGARGGAG